MLSSCSTSIWPRTSSLTSKNCWQSSPNEGGKTVSASSNRLNVSLALFKTLYRESLIKNVLVGRMYTQSSKRSYFLTMAEGSQVFHVLFHIQRTQINVLREIIISTYPAKFEGHGSKLRWTGEVMRISSAVETCWTCALRLQPSNPVCPSKLVAQGRESSFSLPTHQTRRGRQPTENKISSWFPGSLCKMLTLELTTMRSHMRRTWLVSFWLSIICCVNAPGGLFILPTLQILCNLLRKNCCVKCEVLKEVARLMSIAIYLPFVRISSAVWNLKL